MLVKISKSIFTATLIILLISIFSVDAEAQRRRTKKKKTKIEKEDEERSSFSLRDRLYAGAYINTPSIFNSNTGSQFNVGIQPFVGYKYNKYISSGLALKFDYQYLNNQGFVRQLTDFSTTVFTRALIVEQIIFQLEGGLYSDNFSTGFNQKEREAFPIAYVGIGYQSYGTEIILAYELTGNFLNRGILPFEYKFGLVFDF